MGRDRISRSYRCLIDHHAACYDLSCNCGCHQKRKKPYRPMSSTYIIPRNSVVTRGRRLCDGKAVELEPADYQRSLIDDQDFLLDGQEPYYIWRMRPPNGIPEAIINQKTHRIQINTDGTISLSPSLWFHKDGPESWHGFFDDGLWITSPPVPEAKTKIPEAKNKTWETPDAKNRTWGFRL